MNRKISNDELGRLSEDDYKLVPKIPVVVVLDNVRSAQNVGSVFRTADSFRIEKIFLCGITAKPPLREINKTALGATKTVDWQYYLNTTSCVDELRKKGYRCASVEQTENAIQVGTFQPDKNEKYALVFGNEVDGVDQEVVNRCDFSLEIPQFGTKHSLNISVCAGVVIWEMAKAFHFT